MNFIYNISIILKIVSKLQMLSFYGCSKWDWMVITGPDLEFVATVATGGRVKFLSAV